MNVKMPARARSVVKVGSISPFGTRSLTSALAPVLTPERLLRWSLGLVFLWFGVLKLANVSPVLEFLRQTYPMLATPAGYAGLAIIECVLGGLLLAGVWNRGAALATVLHLCGTLSVMVSSPHAVFQSGFPVLNMEGEFVVKNLVLMAAACTLWLMGCERAASQPVAVIRRPMVLSEDETAA